MNAQWVVVAVVVLVSAIYATWTLMPASLRRAFAAASLRLALPRAVEAWMRTHAETTSSCACSGCDRNSPAGSGATATPPATVRPITLHRRLPG